ncbi:hypothetical protein EDB86DRAFT_3104760 [Lactarius hatsudake]|nr:hypothetical protein EDB86DRAFT_3104760 [Lactarius hatsudake]
MPGSDWTSNEPRVYNIRVAPQDVATFFGDPTLPQPSVHRAILDNKSYPHDGIADRGDRNFFFYLEAAMKIPTADEPIVDEFPAWLLRLLGEPIRAKAIPGIVMLGTTPTFYKIIVTQDLVDAVEASRYPQNPTTVHRLELPVDDLNGLDGMRALDDRAVLLGCFEAFKQFVVA